MRIAFVTDDGETLSAHFGRAAHYLIVEVRDGKEVTRKLVKKAGRYERGPGEGRGEHGGGRGGGHGARFKLLEGCDVLIARGMGNRAYARAQGMGLEVILCDEKAIDAALRAHLDGALTHNPKRLHASQR